MRRYWPHNTRRTPRLYHDLGMEVPTMNTFTLLSTLAAPRCGAVGMATGLGQGQGVAFAMYAMNKDLIPLNYKV